MNPGNLNLQIATLNNLEAAENANHERRYFLRDNDPFNTLSDGHFIKQFRISKRLTNFLLEMLDDVLLPPTRASAVDKRTKVLIALNFFANGSYQTSVGSNIFCSGVSQSVVSNCIDEVVNGLNNPFIFNEWVTFPNLQELQNIRRRFFDKYDIPGIIGVIDCTHVAIFPPPANHPVHPEHVYVNRKQYHSINVQLICDDNLRITNINSRFPGSTHDSHIWNNSAISNAMVNLSRQHGFFLIGDSGYALRPWLQTPVVNAVPGTAEDAYNEAFRRARSLIERCNGLLKMRFRCLLKHRVLHYTPSKASLIINACTVLHNLCIANNMPYPEPDEEDYESFDFGIIRLNNIPPANARNPDLIAGERLQATIIHNYFRN